MRRALYIFFLFILVDLVSAQKLVIGSETPSFKSLKDDISWLTRKPGTLPLLIDFYQPSNPTCVDNLARLLKIAESNRGVIDVVVLTREQDDKLKELFGKVCVGVDTTSNGFFKKCHVQYLPYTMIVDEKSRLLWHGILNALSDEMLEERLQLNGR